MRAYGGRGAEKTADRQALRQVIDMPAIVGHLSQSLQRELDFTSELENMQRMRRVLEPCGRQSHREPKSRGCGERPATDSGR